MNALQPASILVLEDESARIEMMEDWFAPQTVYATDFIPDFLAKAAQGGWSLILLDYDLNPENTGPTGYDAALALGDPATPAFRACSYAPVVVHSLNLKQAYEIVGALWQWDAPVVRLPFHLLPNHLHWIRVLMGVEA